ncbi:MAG TPA: YwiC-like family protein [Pyrinomonadaceae bacterium]
MAARVDVEKGLGEVKAGTGGVRLKTVALPTEHGGWGITLEPVVLGLLVAPSVAGAGLALATVAAFLARHPFKIVAGDRRRGRRFARTPYAERFTLVYVAVALEGMVLAFLTAKDYTFLLPLAVAAPLAAVQLWYDAEGRSRGLLPELAGSVAMGSVACSLALAGGAGWPLALGLWALLAARFVPAIVYVRARLTELHGKEFARWPSLAAHVVAVVAAVMLAAFKLLPWLAAVATVVLLARAAYGFARRWPSTAKRVGFSEIAFGALTVAAAAVGVAFGI